MKYYRVKTGYHADDFISIDETELERAIMAQGTGKVAVFKGGTVAGNHIMTIKTDLHKIMGFNPLYEMKAGDLDTYPPLAYYEHNKFLAEISNRINGDHLTPPRQTTQIHTQGMKSLGDIIKKDTSTLGEITK